jgi:hypothetical protein
MDREYHLPQFRKLQVGLSIVSKESVLILQIRQNHPGDNLQAQDKTLRKRRNMQGSNIYRCIFLDKRAEGWVREEGFVTWQLQKAFLLTTQKLPARVFNFNKDLSQEVCAQSIELAI